MVVSDWYAVYDTVRSVRSGEDVEMPGPARHWGDALVGKVRAGSVEEADVDDKVRRVLRLAARVGALDRPGPRARGGVTDPVATRRLLRTAAARGSVLLRNDGLLPLDGAGLRRVAVLGPNAATARVQGGGSAGVFPAEVVSPLLGLQRALGSGVEVVHTPGSLPVDRPQSVTPDLVTDPETGEPGVRAGFIAADGSVLFSENRRSGWLQWDRTAGVFAAARVEVRAVLTADVGGEWVLGVGGAGDVRLTVDGVVVEGHLAQDPDAAAGRLAQPLVTHRSELAAGQRVVVAASRAVPLPTSSPGAGGDTVDPDVPDLPDFVDIDLVVRGPRRTDADELAAAVELARTSDVAVVVVGTSELEESEGFDRDTLALLGNKDELVRRVTAVNPRTVIVVNAGAPVLMPWREQVGAVLVVWFPGQEAGNALADVLLGLVEPGGRLPTTWPVAQQDVPVLDTTPVDGRLVYEEGVHVGYRAWLRRGAEPAYWFGHGLGYTTWELSGLLVDGRTVSLDVRNTGVRRGRQVVQVYLARPSSSIDRPVRWLAAFGAVELDACGRQRVAIPVPPEGFRHWADGWQVEPGVFEVHVGTSVVDLPLAGTISV